MRTLPIASLAGLLLGIGMILAGPLPAAAQLGDDRVDEQLRATDEGLGRAREIVVESRSPRAREVLDRAVRVQDEAWNQFRGGRPVVAGTLTREARLLGMRAVSLAREDFSFDQRAEREQERAVRALESARESFDGSPGEPAGRLLEEAREQIDRARAQIQERHFEVAIRLAVSAQRLIRQAIGQAAGGDSEILLRELERTAQLIERVRDVIAEGDDEQAARLVQQAESLQRSARDAHAAGRAVVALAATREARDVANRALDQAQGAINADGVGEVLAETDTYLERAAQIVAESGDERGVELLAKAREHQRRAAGALGEEQMRAALAETRVARSLAKRAVQLAEGGSGE